jgi:glycosyltransferase involved in cell wall biosynthesis
MKRLILDDPLGFDAVHCHDANAALVGYFVSRKLSIPLVCDYHELFMDYLSPHGARKGIIKLLALLVIDRIWQAAARAIATRADAFITVNDSLASIYSKKWRLPRPPLVLHNYSSSDPGKKNFDPNYLRSKLGISPHRRLLIFQGSLFYDKGVEVILKAFQDQEEFAVVFLGEGALRLLIEQYSKLCEGSFYWHPPVPAEDLLAYTRCADAGLAPIGDSKPNHIYSSPNKVFEYLAAGIPFVCTDLPEMARIASESGAGIVVPVGNPAALLEATRELFSSESRQKAYGKLARESFRGKYCWEKESGRLRDLYQRLLGS